MPDAPQETGTPLWGWVIIVAVIAMFVGLVLKALSTGGGHMTGR